MTQQPVVSVIVACYNSAAYLSEALRSAQAQTLGEIEILVIDDCSTDDSVELAERCAVADPRIRVIRMDRNGGPAAARNRGFAAARGDWLAILDADDLMHPERLARLVAEAEASGADLIADDLMLFDDGGTMAPHTFLDASRNREPGWIDLAGYSNDAVMFGPRPNPGFLKPLIHRRALAPEQPAYDESLRIAEDDELVMRLLLEGRRYRLMPEPLYFYRKHGNSISHRMSAADIDAIVATSTTYHARIGARAPHALPAFGRRHRGALRAQAFTHVIGALKARRLGEAVRVTMRRPSLLGLMRLPIMGRLARLRGAARPPAPPANVGRNVAIVSRQRLTGATNGSSAYLLDLAKAVREAGLVPHLVQPSPVIFGRTPMLRMRPEMAVFDSHRIRGAIRIGDRFIALDPDIYMQAALGIGRRIVRKLGARGAWTLDRRLPHSISRPWRVADRLYLAQHGRPLADIVIADYVFQAPALPYLLRPDAPSAIVMHDLYHVRAGTFAGREAEDSIAGMDEPTERALFRQADAVIAIQAEEARYLTASVPEVVPILAPMATATVAAAQPGEADRLLFVASNTAPNIDGLRWFFDEVWATIRAARPDMVLDIAGTAAHAFAEGGPPGTRFLGLVDDLAGAYARAGVVISPLRQGSGLKIKLIEALGHGKAIVATGVTLQGVEDLAPDAVIHADSPADQAAAIVGLMADPGRRAALAGRALAAAGTRFSADACHADFRRWLHGAANGRVPNPLLNIEA